MSPTRRIRMYERANKNVSSVDAVNILFAKNLTKRKLTTIGRKPNRKIKGLRSEQYHLHNDSFNASLENTFDKLLEGEVNFKDHVSKANLLDWESCSTPKIVCKDKRNNITSLKETSTNSRKRKKTPLTLSNTSTSATYNRSLRSSKKIPVGNLKVILDHTSVENIDVSLAVENSMKKEHIFSSLSYIKVPEDAVISDINKENNSLKPLRTSVSQCFFSSTPIRAKRFTRASQKQELLGLIVNESFHEIQKWSDTFPYGKSYVQRVLRSNKSKSFCSELEVSHRNKGCETKRPRKSKSTTSISEKNKQNLVCSLKEFESFENYINSDKSSLSAASKEDSIETENHSRKKRKCDYSVEAMESFFKQHKGFLTSEDEDFGDKKFCHVTKRRCQSSNNSTKSTETSFKKLPKQIRANKFQLKELVVLLNRNSLNINRKLLPKKENNHRKLSYRRSKNNLPKIRTESCSVKQPVVNLTRINIETLNSVRKKPLIELSRLSNFQSKNDLKIIQGIDRSEICSKNSFVNHSNSIISVSDDSNLIQDISTKKNYKTDNETIALPKLVNNLESRRPLSSQRGAEISAFPRNRLGNFKEESLDSSQVGDGLFKVPCYIEPKPLVLKSGKCWRRSFSAYKQSSVQENVISNLNHSIQRHSVRIVPVSPHRTRHNILESYVLSNLSFDAYNLKTLSLRKPSISQLTAREIVFLNICKQIVPLSFDTTYPKSLLKNCKKIGEGVYGEVFMYSKANNNTTVMKIIPIEGDQIINGERQKKFEEILSEIVIALELSNLHNTKHNQTSAFSKVQNIYCVQGKYPQYLLDLWKQYDNCKGSENDSPEIFKEDQLYVVLELANGGKDLESFIFNNALQAYTMFTQVACALAIAERQLEFEHRDLHWGNVLLTAVNKNKKVTFSLEGRNIDIATKGVEVAIIDFTLSRIKYDGVIIFNDLGQDPDLFTAEGDYQFAIYRLMKQNNDNDWQRFEPFTNILWLHYILDKAEKALHYKNNQSKLHKEYINKIVDIKNNILSFKCVEDFVNKYF